MASVDDANSENGKAEIVYKTKIVQFFGRSVPIILQNDNGPCPLLAICNVLLLRNTLSLSLDITEVASSRLLTLVAERLIDSNSNTEGKNEEYVRNQQQNISDALPLLNHLVTGLDVNVRFRNIHDFEFTPECAVFDLLDIGLVHGWLCDPQDEVTSNILAPHSYNTLVEKLVELQATKADLQATADTVDFAAATTATLGVPSPSRAVLLNTNSFDRQDANTADYNSEQKGDVEKENAQLQRKGDVEETAELLKALKLSSVGALSNPEQKPKTATNAEDPVDIGVNTLVPAAESESSNLRNNEEELCSLPPDIDSKTLQNFPTVYESNECNQLGSGSGRDNITVSVEKTNDREGGDETQGDSKAAATSSSLPVIDKDGLSTSFAEGQTYSLQFEARPDLLGDAADLSKEEDSVQFKVTGHQNLHAVEPEVMDPQNLMSVSRPLGYNVDLNASPSSFSASSEPLYEGEAEISAGASGFETREPLYEGEANLAECTGQIGNEEEGAIISSFLKSNATQLTYYGLFCLQEGLKERELCVFFRNNHFSTMFKYKGDLYLLVTDQGYLSQPDIVWEKLDEVHGDTVFVTGTFTPFQAGESSGLWDEQGAIAATADYLSSHQRSVSKDAKELGGNNLDFDLAVVLQQEEFEQQQQQQQQQARTVSSASARQSQKDSTMRTDGSRLITGPKKSSYSYKPETKSKCAIM